MDNKKQPKDKADKKGLLETIPPEDLIAAYNALFEAAPQRQEEDAYSLAQPHAFRFVPNLLSNNTRDQ